MSWFVHAPTHLAGHWLARRYLDWLRRGRVPEAAADPVAGRRRLAYSRRYRTNELLVVLFSALFPLSAWILRAETAWSLLCLGIFAVLAPYVAFRLRETFLVDLAYTEEGLHLRRRPGRASFIPWASIAAARMSANGDDLLLVAPGRPPVRVNLFLSGLASFFECAARNLERAPAGRLPPGVADQARNP